MLEHRKYFQLIFFNEKVFAVGGETVYGVLHSVEYYDDNNNAWKKVASMNCGRTQHAAFVYNNLLYVVGGNYNDRRLQTSVEYYDPSIDKWTLV